MRFMMTLLLAFFILSSLSGQKIDSKKTYPEFPIGISGIFATIKNKKVIVTKTAKNSPADGKLKTGDILVSVNGINLDIDDPRPILGKALNTADALGVLKVKTQRKSHILKFTKIGEYSKSWPIKCNKTKAIIKQNAEFIVKSQQEDGSYRLSNRSIRDDLSGCLVGIFLLSTGEDKYLKNIKKQIVPLAQNIRRSPTQNNWQIGYQGILLGEYYLRTGDEFVLTALEALCRQAEKTQAAGGWGHSGVLKSPGYVQSGLMNSAGLPVLTTLILAKECGIKVNEKSYKEALNFGFRFVGHGCAPYGDHRSEIGWSNTNGRNGMLGTALFLLPESKYKLAGQHLAMLVADSYVQPEFGHTGGGFNVIWRGMSSSLVPTNERSRYHKQMNELAWYYDLCRMPGGGFTILPTPPDNGRYSNIEWGTGAVGLTYTAPLRTLRITGKKPTKFSKVSPTPKIQFGNSEDLTFLKTSHAEGFGKNSHTPAQIYHLLIGDNHKESNANFCLKHLLHYNPLVRFWSAKRLNNLVDSKVFSALKKLSKHSDTRVRRAVYDTISAYTPWSRPFKSRFSQEDASRIAIKAIEKTLNSNSSAWWEIDGALFALSKCKPADIRRNMSNILKFSKHEEWYLREASFWAITGLGESIKGTEFQILTDIYKDSDRAFARSSYDSGFKDLIRNKKVKLDDKNLVQTMATFGYMTHSPNVAYGYDQKGALHEATHRTMMILAKFDNSMFEYMVKDLQTYLDKQWEPYYQHSVWLITGNKWQPGLLKVMNTLGKNGKPIRDSLAKILKQYSKYDTERIRQRKAENIEGEISKALQEWDAKFNK